MRLIVCFLLIMCAGKIAYAQSVGVGTSTPHPSAVLDVTSNNKGFLLPSMSQTQRISISNPANGLLVYDTTLNRFYQFQDGTWRYIINSELWAVSTSRRHVYNTTDSIGIGTSLPQEKLDVNGDVLARGDINVATTLEAGNLVSAATLSAEGNMNVNGSAIFASNLNVNGEVIIDNPGATLQFRQGTTNKAFFQSNGNNLRLGTNSGNDNGKVIFRLNGKNVMEIDQQANLSLLRFSGNQKLGTLIVGEKITKSFSETPGNNYLTVMYGQVFSDGTSVSLWPATGSTTKISTGIYEINTNNSAVSDKGCIVVTAEGSTPRICVGRYTSAGKFRVEIFNMSGGRVDNDFYFMINDPLN